jgi:uncharacterized protein (DUF2141 family)
VISKRLAVAVCVLIAIACVNRRAPVPVDRDPADSRAAHLTVRLLGLESGRGEVAVALYASAESFEKRSDPVASGWVQPRNGTAVWIVETLDPGRYAIAAYHDLNGNGRLDRSALGVPSEPYGFSNDARRTFRPPGFDKAAFPVHSGTQTTELTLR